ncbi:WD40 repeat domain-containing protein [Acidobacteria bacterium AH-259-D05]|nr:WD40 repeat domain-containing protein [Acidobacteria bacterium AH-259-D05]
MSQDKRPNKGEIVKLRTGKITKSPGSLIERGLALADHVSSQPTLIRPVGELRRFEGHTDSVTSVAFSADGRRALSGSSDKTVRLWDVRDGCEIRRFGDQILDFVDSVAFSPDGCLILCGCRDGTVHLWNVGSGLKIHYFKGHAWDVTRVSFSPNGNLIASVGFEEEGGRLVYGRRTVRLWDVRDMEEIGCLDIDNPTYDFTFSPDSRRILAGFTILQVWDIETLDKIQSFNRLRSVGRVFDCVSSLAFSPEGCRILSGCSSGIIHLLDVKSGREIRRFKHRGHEPYSLTTSVSFSSDGTRFLSGAYNTIRLWDVETDKEICCFKGHASSVTSVAFSPTGGHAVSGSLDSTVRLWKLPD